MMSRPLRDLGPLARLRTPGAPLAMGSALGTARASGGSLGAFVRDPCLPGAVLALTARHALAGFGDFLPGETVWAPWPSLAGAARVGVAHRALALGPGGAAGALDAALVTLDASTAWTGPSEVTGAVRTLGPGDAGTRLHKVGAASGHTTARLVAWHAAWSLPWPGVGGGTVALGPVLEIRDETGVAWSDGGDSGGLVFTDAGDPVGLVLAGGVDDRGAVSYATPLGLVLDALGVTLAAGADRVA